MVTFGDRISVRLCHDVDCACALWGRMSYTGWSALHCNMRCDERALDRQIGLDPQSLTCADRRLVTASCMAIDLSCAALFLFVTFSIYTFGLAVSLQRNDSYVGRFTKVFFNYTKGYYML